MSDCSQKHHSLLHSLVRLSSNHSDPPPSINCASMKNDVHVVKNCLVIIPVVSRGESRKCSMYALLDDSADKTLSDEHLLKNLHVHTRPVTFKMSTVRGTGSINHGQQVDLEVQPVNGDDNVLLHKVWSVKSLLITMNSAAVNADL